MMRRRLPGVLGGYAKRQVARFHMPGHKGRGMAGFFNPELIGWDITELSFSDDLNNPSNVILEAQMECAKSYGAEHTFFLINGSTGGINALMLSLPRGSKLVVSRDCHRSVIYGAGLAGHSVRFITPHCFDDIGIYGSLSLDELDMALTNEPVDAVFITSPNYYGLCADMGAISKITRKHNALLFVDAAHGAHFAFSDKLPITPADYADAWVNSAHKTLNALGQASYLNIGKHMDFDRVRRALSMTQTSSPSYLLLASLDWARYTASVPNVWTDCVKSSLKLKKRINTILGLKTLGRSLIGKSGIVDMDETRVCIDVSERGITGYEAQEALERSDVFVEMADERHVVCIMTPADDPVWHDQLIDALERLPYGMPKQFSLTSVTLIGERAMDLSEAIRAKTKRLPLEEAAFHVAADAVGVYPPGVPLLVPGERITCGQVELLTKQIEIGASLFGISNGCIAVVDN